MESLAIFNDIDACHVCEIEVCHHGRLHVSWNWKGKIYKCLDCGLKVDSYDEMAVYCLPFYEGKVDWESKVYSDVCGKCYMEAVN